MDEFEQFDVEDGRLHWTFLAEFFDIVRIALLAQIIP